ncbi:MAG: ribulose-phosphate 3-epimerase [Bacilli bacterium]
MTKVAPSILGVKDEDLIPTCTSLLNDGADYIHFDVMDGFFVENKSFSPTVLSKLKKALPRAFFDVHLMIINVEQQVDKYIDAGADLITFHYEAVEKENMIALINHIHQRGCKVGISINPNTSYKEIKSYIPYIDLVLVMSVEPGKGGQTFMMSALEKIENIFALKVLNPYLMIEVDGGINALTGALCTQKGADVLVAGSYILKSESYKERIESLK